jgi:hypothetical protein
MDIVMSVVVDVPVVSVVVTDVPVVAVCVVALPVVAVVVSDDAVKVVPVKVVVSEAVIVN